MHGQRVVDASSMFTIKTLQAPVALLVCGRKFQASLPAWHVISKAFIVIGWL
jgi:hypothetical protein